MLQKKLTLGIAGLAIAALAFAAGKEADPVLLTVNGKPVQKSEFEYLYKKNSSQQVNPQGLDEYLKMFVDYKLKVAEAEAEGIDTTAAFRTEYNQFRQELAGPYLRDTAYLEKMVKEAYQHMLREVKVSHIMFDSPMETNADNPAYHLADSLRTELINGRADWDSIAARYSIDRGSNQRGGTMGWLGVNRTPWAFEKAAYDTPIGQISKPVNSGFGIHLVRPDAERPARGEVLVQHILKMTMRRSPEEAEQARLQIDSIYNVLTKPGANFDEVAAAESEDGTRSKGGRLDWFGAGMMVAEFDSVAFALKDGEISKPFATPYGYHIVKRLDHRGVPALEQVHKEIYDRVEGDERGNEAKRVYAESLIKEFGGQVLNDNIDKIRNDIAASAGGYDSTAIAKLRASSIPVYKINGVEYPVSSIMHLLPITASTDADNARRLISGSAYDAMRNRAYDLQRDRLPELSTEYRNLANEYRDGILLFEVSNRNVWDKAAKDSEGLKKFFAENKDKYKWEKPKYKGFIIFANSDSLLNEVRQYAESLGDKFDAATFASDVRAKFGRDVKAERVLAAKGDNAISDYLIFDGPKPDDSNLRWQHFMAFGGHIADAPEEVIDVRGQVTTDYQNALEKEWVKKLRSKYKVKINKKVLDSLR